MEIVQMPNSYNEILQRAQDRPFKLAEVLQAKQKHDMEMQKLRMEMQEKLLEQKRAEDLRKAVPGIMQMEPGELGPEIGRGDPSIGILSGMLPGGLGTSVEKATRPFRNEMVSPTQGPANNLRTDIPSASIRSAQPTLSPDALVNYGRALAAAGKTDEAVKIFMGMQKGAKVDPNSPEVLAQKQKDKMALHQAITDRAMNLQSRREAMVREIRASNRTDAEKALAEKRVDAEVAREWQAVLAEYQNAYRDYDRSQQFHWTPDGTQGATSGEILNHPVPRPQAPVPPPAPAAGQAAQALPPRMGGKPPASPVGPMNLPMRLGGEQPAQTTGGEVLDAAGNPVGGVELPKREFSSDNVDESGAMPVYPSEPLPAPDASGTQQLYPNRPKFAGKTSAGKKINYQQLKMRSFDLADKAVGKDMPKIMNTVDQFISSNQGYFDRIRSAPDDARYTAEKRSYDKNLIAAIAKLTDPISVIRESEISYWARLGQTLTESLSKWAASLAPGGGDVILNNSERESLTAGLQDLKKFWTNKALARNAYARRNFKVDAEVAGGLPADIAKELGAGWSLDMLPDETPSVPASGTARPSFDDLWNKHTGGSK